MNKQVSWESHGCGDACVPRSEEAALVHIIRNWELGMRHDDWESGSWASGSLERTVRTREQRGRQRGVRFRGAMAARVSRALFATFVFTFAARRRRDRVHVIYTSSVVRRPVSDSGGSYAHDNNIPGLKFTCAFAAHQQVRAYHSEIALSRSQFSSFRHRTAHRQKEAEQKLYSFYVYQCCHN